MEGQVIALHKFVGQPPFSANMHGSFDIPSPMATLFGGLVTGEGSDQSTVDFDNIPSAPTTIHDTCRYRTMIITNGSGSYVHSRTCAKHDGGGLGGAFLVNGGGLVREELSAFRLDGTYETWIFQLNDDGSFKTGLNCHNTPPTLTDYHNSLECDNIALALPDFPGDGWTGGTSGGYVEVTATTVHLHTDNPATLDSDPTQVKHDIHDFSLSLSDGWSLADLQAELDRMLAQVDLTNASKKYTIDGTQRKLNATGEQITVTEEGPTEGVAVHYVLSSTASPWNWASYGPCVLAENVNDFINHWLDGGYCDENGIPLSWAKGDIMGATGDPFKMVKSSILLPGGAFTKTVDHYSGPSPDGASYPNDQNDQTGGQLLSQDVTAVTDAGKLTAFPRGDWISRTKLAPATTPPPSIDADSTRPVPAPASRLS